MTGEMKTRLIPTRYRLIKADQTVKDFAADLPRSPGYEALCKIIEPLLDDQSLEQVSVLADFDGGARYQALDMFVDGNGRLRGLSRNEIATAHYRRANLMGETASPKAADPEILHFIVGPAIIFDRRVWR